MWIESFGWENWKWDCIPIHVVALNPQLSTGHAAPRPLAQSVLGELTWWTTAAIKTGADVVTGRLSCPWRVSTRPNRSATGSDLISFSEGILDSYPHTIPSCSEYFDSNAAESTDDGQAIPKTEIGQTVSTNDKAVTQSCAYTINESLGLSKSFHDYPKGSRIRMKNTESI
jgi:hypothetical protein